MTLQGLGTETVDFGRFPLLTAEVADGADKLNIALLASLGSQYHLRLVGESGRARVEEWSKVFGTLQKSLLQLVELSKQLAEVWDDEREVPTEVWELKSITRKLEGLSQTLDRYNDFERDPASVFWLERVRDGKGLSVVNLVISPVSVSSLMKKAVFDPYGTVILTSATLAVRGNFQFWAGRVGWDLVDQERQKSGMFPSPFDYANRVLLGVPVDFPLPDDARYSSMLESYITQLLVVSGGRGLVLFTSYESLRQAYSKVQPAMAAQGISVYRQGDEERSRLLTRFRDEVTSVLFATDSFWEGVDSPGDTLKMVVVCRLPFRVPPSH